MFSGVKHIVMTDVTLDHVTVSSWTGLRKVTLAEDDNGFKGLSDLL